MCNLLDYMCKPADYSNPLDYMCNLPDYTCNPLDYCNPADYTCKPVHYTCNPVDYTCKLLNFRFTTPILITAGHCGGNTLFFKNFSPCPVIRWITLVKYLISGLQLLFCGSNGYCNTSDSGGSNIHIGLHM